MKTGKSIFLLIIVIITINLNAQNKNNNIQFSSSPFKDDVQTQSEFKFKSPIYAKLKLDKNLSAYAQKLDDYDLNNIADKSKYSHCLIFYVCPKNEDMSSRSWSEIKLIVSSDQLNQNSITLDILPDQKKATSFFKTGFNSELTKSGLISYDPTEGTSKGEKSEFDIYIMERKTAINDEVDNKHIFNFGVFAYLGNIAIDYTSVTDVREVMDWNKTQQDIIELIQNKFK